MTLAPGARLGPYEIVSPLGAGGMGEVYRARDTRLGREVAVKVLPAEVAGDAERLRRFEQEARAASALNHPNLLILFDVGAEDGTSYLITELLEGESFRELVRKGPLPPKRAVELTIQIARGLAAAHEKGIVHRDLKPENLFLTRDGTVKILDFGLARVAPRETSASELARAPTVEELTGEGTVLGTVGYMSPEQVRGEPADARSDLFSLGCVLLEMLTGRRAFAGESAVDTMHAILRSEPAGTHKLVGVSPALGDLVARCLEKRRDRRFQTAADLVFALEHIESTPGTGRVIHGESKKRTHWIAIAVAVLLVSAGVGALLLRSRASTGTSATTPTYHRIAVLPFEVSRDSREDLGPIADGLAQALIIDLSRLPDLHVTPWMTARRYSESNLAPAALAQEMSVEALLAISLASVSGSVQADLALLDGGTGLQTWGDRIAAAVGDPATLRARLISSSARELRPDSTTGRSSNGHRIAGGQPEAYLLALKAASVLDSASRASVEKAESLARRALELDSRQPLALRVRGSIEYYRYYYGWDGDQTNLELAERFFEESLALDPLDTEAYGGLIRVHWIRHYDTEVLDVAARLKATGLESAEKLCVFAEAYLFVGLDPPAIDLFRRALALDPANEVAKYSLGILMLGTEEGTRLLKETIARYGESGRRRMSLGRSKFVAGDLSGAEIDLRRAIELAPDDILAYYPLGNLLVKKGELAQARSLWTGALEQSRRMLASTPRSDRVRQFIVVLSALLNRLSDEPQNPEQAAVEISGNENCYLPALRGDFDRATACGLAWFDAGHLGAPELFRDPLEAWGLEALALHRGYARVKAREKQALAEALARYPID